MKYTYVLPIGDWSKDGHSQSENVTMAVNKPKEEIIAAYHETTSLLNMTFDSNDMRESDPVRLINRWGDSKLDAKVVDILLHFGVHFEKFEGYQGPGCDLWIYDAEEAAILFMEFVRISLPDLEYGVVRDQTSYLFGYWGDLNISVGYGIFE